MLITLEALSLAFCVSFLLFGAWSDLKMREVSNKLWAVSLPIVTTITVIRMVLSMDLLLLNLISIALSIIVSLAIFEGGFFGGADAKAMICLGVALPLFPGIFHPVLGCFHPFFPIIVLSNGFLISLVSILYVVAKNLEWKLRVRGLLLYGFEEEHFLKKLLVVLSGYKVELDELRKRPHLIPIEDVDEAGGVPRRKMRLFADVEADTDVVIGRLEKYASAGLVPSMVWVTPGLPMLVFILLGFLATLFLGDIPLCLVSRLLA
jgi:preflagellin peptidase FlaK